MELNSGELYTLALDPLLILMAAECEDVEDEIEFAAISDERESNLLAAQAYTAVRQSNQSY